MKFWLWVGSLVGGALLAVFVLTLIFTPLGEHNSTTVVAANCTSAEAVARALAPAIGNPSATLNTDEIHRYLFPDGTSVDCIIHMPTEALLYKPIAFKTITLSPFSSEQPAEKAQKIADEFKKQGRGIQVLDQPDPAFPKGSIVIVLSTAMEVEPGYGFGILVRKNAFRVGGQRPKVGSPF